MIERKLLHTKLRDYQINEVLANSLSRVGFSSSKLKKTPLGEKITIVASRPGLVVGRKGSNIKALTKTLKTKFKLENPQIEIEEVPNQSLDAQIVAEKIQSAMERFGTKKFKGIGHKAMDDIMSAGALGVEILVSGKVPSQRAKRWRFYKGYLKKSGDVAVSKVATAYAAAHLKSGSVGIQVRIMLPETWLPDRVDVLEMEEAVSEVQDDGAEVVDEGEEKHESMPEESSDSEDADVSKEEETGGSGSSDESGSTETKETNKPETTEAESKDSKKEAESQTDAGTKK
ncbi:MAG: 30S ribosomal protein S3 [Candidatus Woesearchaeota archaeon]